MGRRESRIDPDGGPVAEFALELRRLRERAGSPTYRELSERTRFVPSVLSAATRGSRLATWPVVRAFVAACGGDVSLWQRRWREVSEAAHVTFAEVEGGQAQPSPQQPVAAPIPRHLPTDTRAFTGRTAELERLLALAGESGDELSEQDVFSGAVVITAIDGMAGIGKTALALRAGHLLADRFPDGQLFIDLHGYTPGMPPREPAEALAVLLRSLGMTPDRIPEGLDARAALYRARLAETRTLILLDNAATEAQVRPLLPASNTCLVLVTSRRRLRALHDARALSLDVLSEADAVALLRQMLNGTGSDPTTDTVLVELAHRCGYLPLTLRMAAAFLRHRPSWTPRHLVDTLSEGAATLQGSIDRDRDLATVFGLSYRTLGRSHQVLFRRLGLAPGPDIDAFAAAALLDTEPANADRLLQDLVDNNLLTEPAPGRYQLHDLLREHARSLCARDPAKERDAAVGRLLDFYQNTAAYADARIARQTRIRAATPARQTESRPNLPPIPALADPERSRAWLRAERVNLVACLEHAEDRGLNTRVIMLSRGLANLLRTDGPWQQALAVHKAALAAAERLANRHSQADALSDLATIRRLTDDFAGALRDQEAALALYRTLGDRQGAANALSELATVQQMTGDYLVALRNQEKALDQYRELGDTLGQANALLDLGVVRQMTGDGSGALSGLATALRLYRELGDQLGQANAQVRLGNVKQLAGDFPGALADLEAALDRYRRLGDRLGLVSALPRLGTVRQMTGDYAGALRDLAEALDLCRSLGDRFGEANTLVRLGALRRVVGDDAGAQRDQEAALRLCREIEYRHGAANALTELGMVRQTAGDYLGALRDLEEALKLYREGGSRQGEAWALNYYAAVFLATGEQIHALALYRDALRLTREVQQPDDEALALEGIGRCLLHDGDVQGAGEYLTQSLAIFQRLAMPDAERIEARLAELGPAWLGMVGPPSQATP